MNATCPRCDAALVCGAADKEKPCWCTEMPHIAPADDAKACLCPACLAELVAQEQAKPKGA